MGMTDDNAPPPGPHRAGTLAYRDATGEWRVASPRDALYSSVTMTATHYWRDDDWRLIFEDE